MTKMPLDPLRMPLTPSMNPAICQSVLLGRISVTASLRLKMIFRQPSWLPLGHVISSLMTTPLQPFSMPPRTKIPTNSLGFLAATPFPITATKGTVIRQLLSICGAGPMNTAARITNNASPKFATPTTMSWVIILAMMKMVLRRWDYHNPTNAAGQSRACPTPYSTCLRIPETEHWLAWGPRFWGDS